MTDKTPKVVDALRKLDISNDAHWTTDNLPRLETVKFLAGDQTVTREDVTNAAPGFNRQDVSALERTQTAILAEAESQTEAEAESQTEAEAEAELEVEAGVETPATELPVQEGDFPAVLVSQAEPVQVEGKPAHDADAIAELQASLETAEAGIANLMLAKDELLREIDFANRAADELRDAITTARGSTSTTDVIQQALESRKRQAEARGEVRAALTASGLDMKALARAAAKSPVDQALARKTGRGSARPAHR